jgi:hypothetical protein
MLKKLRSFSVALLLVPLLTLNANAFTADEVGPVYAPTQQQSGYCWVYYFGRWILVPC